MKLDNEQQREALLQIINQSSISGASAEFVVQLKQAIAQAEVESVKNKKADS